jgi:hypothetical protein
MAFTPVQVDRDAWSGEGDLTATLIERLIGIEQVQFVRVEDAPASRAGAGFNFICNEIYVVFRVERTLEMRRTFGVLPLPGIGYRKSLTLGRLEALLAAMTDIGAPDYADTSMLQYLRSERVIPAYQTRGPKHVEVVRIYEAR